MAKVRTAGKYLAAAGLTALVVQGARRAATDEVKKPIGVRAAVIGGSVLTVMVWAATLL